MLYLLPSPLALFLPSHLSTVSFPHLSLFLPLPSPPCSLPFRLSLPQHARAGNRGLALCPARTKAHALCLSESLSSKLCRRMPLETSSTLQPRTAPRPACMRLPTSTLLSPPTRRLRHRPAHLRSAPTPPASFHLASCQPAAAGCLFVCLFVCVRVCCFCCVFYIHSSSPFHPLFPLLPPFYP